MKHICRTVLAVGLLTTPALAPTALAQTPPAAPAAAAPAPAPSKIATLTIGADFTSAYVFRGILQSDQGSIIQPYIDIGLAAGHGVTVNFGNWDSFHSTLPGRYYESDYYFSVTGTAGQWKPGVLFTAYTSPKKAFSTVNELAFVLAYDDSAKKMPWAPKIVLAQELTDKADGLTNHQADAGLHKGTYLELGARPTAKIVEGKAGFSLIVPLKLGLGLKDYYEFGPEPGKLGYFDVGLVGSIPITLSKGTFELHVGVDILRLGDNLPVGTRLSMGDHGKTVVTAGFSYVY